MFTCSSCDVTKPISDFPKKKDTPRGHRKQCRSCYLARQRKTTQKWRDDRSEKQKQKDRSAIVDWQKRNSERKRYTNAEWKKKNKVKVCEHSAKRRTQIKERRFVVSESDLNRIYQSPCTNCGSIEQITADHVVPISRGGVHSVGNLQPLCLSCNSRKHNRLQVEWRYAERK